jgi:hypothetical protein
MLMLSNWYFKMNRTDDRAGFAANELARSMCIHRLRLLTHSAAVSAQCSFDGCRTECTCSNCRTMQHCMTLSHDSHSAVLEADVACDSLQSVTWDAAQSASWSGIQRSP